MVQQCRLYTYTMECVRNLLPRFACIAQANPAVHYYGQHHTALKGALVRVLYTDIEGY